MHTINKLYLIDITGLQDEEVFNFHYKKMPSDRKAKIDRFKPLNSKQLCLGAGILLDRALNDIGMSSYEIVEGDHKKPYIKDCGNVFFNISHSGDMAALAISDKETGIDIQEVQHFGPSLLKHVFNEDELSAALKFCPEGGDIDFFHTRMWTMKEAVMKHSGLGMALEPKNITLTFEGGQPHALCKGYDADGLFFIDYELPGYALTVCTAYDDFDRTPLKIRI